MKHLFLRKLFFRFAWLVLIVTLAACKKKAPVDNTATGPAAGDKQQVEAPAVETTPAPMQQPVPLWQKGQVANTVDAATAGLHGYLVLDLGEAWTPYIFTERRNATEPAVPNTYRATYLALAQGKLPPDPHGERAMRDKYLELYGIPPTLAVLRERFAQVRAFDCLNTLNLEPLFRFEGFVTYRGNERAERDVQAYAWQRAKMLKLARKYHVATPTDLSPDQMDDQEAADFRQYIKLATQVEAITAAQQRLRCEGYLKGKGKVIEGGLDWATHEALAEFERRHRVYGWGYIGKDTLNILRKNTLELEREGVIRVLTERAMHAAGVLEDGSTATKGDGTPRVYRDAKGNEHSIPNLEAQLQKNLMDAFGLHTPESTLAWLEQLGPLLPTQSRSVAIEAPRWPAYYDGDMELSVVIDRGDVWYDFPYDEQGKEIHQPVERRPHVTVYVQYEGQNIPIARYGTTIGGWRSELVDGQVLWKYKESPMGPRIWSQIVAAPVWIPPESTPPKDLMERVPKGYGKDKYQIDFYEIGPSYASAYGLVAAYHLKFWKNRAGQIMSTADEGIRTHGSVDYMSIARRHSHGCHRLHNHLAVRLMSFILAHRPHQRLGQDRVRIERKIPYEEYEYDLKILEGGYVFQLDRPVPVEVTEGTIVGKLKEPSEVGIPKYDADAGAYLLPDGGGAVLFRNGALQPAPLPVLVPVSPLTTPLVTPPTDVQPTAVPPTGIPTVSVPQSGSGK